MNKIRNLVVAILVLLTMVTACDGRTTEGNADACSKRKESEQVEVQACYDINGNIVILQASGRIKPYPPTSPHEIFLSVSLVDPKGKTNTKKTCSVEVFDLSVDTIADCTTKIHKKTVPYGSEVLATITMKEYPSFVMKVTTIPLRVHL